MQPPTSPLPANPALDGQFAHRKHGRCWPHLGAVGSTKHISMVPSSPAKDFQRANLVFPARTARPFSPWARGDDEAMNHRVHINSFLQAGLLGPAPLLSPTPSPVPEPGHVESPGHPESWASPPAKVARAWTLTSPLTPTSDPEGAWLVRRRGWDGGDAVDSSPCLAL